MVSNLISYIFHMVSGIYVSYRLNMTVSNLTFAGYLGRSIRIQFAPHVTSSRMSNLYLPMVLLWCIFCRRFDERGSGTGRDYNKQICYTFQNWCLHHLFWHEYFAFIRRQLFSSWWFQPIWKISVKLDNFPNFRGKTSKNIWNHQLVLDLQTPSCQPRFFTLTHLDVESCALSLTL